MKKFILSFAVLMASISSNAQLYVSSGSYVFANDQYLFVKGDVNLASSGNVYLRNQSQLLQGKTGVGANTGLGELSIFQEGTTNNYQYNYWCSPVGVPSASVGNTSFGVSRLFQPNGLITSLAAVLTNGLDGVAGPALTISSRWIYTYTSSNLYSQWNYIGAASTVQPGYGFTMKGTSGTDNTVAVPLEDANESVAGIQPKYNNPGSSQRYDFRGKPNDGDIYIPVSGTAGAVYANTTLVGNPYPSSLNINMFLLENSGYTIDYFPGTGFYSLTGAPIIDGVALFWEHNKSNNSHQVGDYVGGYGTYVPNGVTVYNPGTYTAAPWHTYSDDGENFTAGGSGGNSYQRMFKPVGQGFMVRGVVASGNVVMKNIYRAYRKEGSFYASEFERNAATSDSENSNWDEIPNVAGADYTQFSRLPVPQFKIRTKINDLQMYEMAVAFNPNATDNFDLALDAKSTFADEVKSTYFVSNLADKKLVITTLPFDINKRIPIAFKTDVSTTFAVKVSEIINFNDAENIFLYDKETGIYHDIKNSIYTMVLPAGENADRFEITFLDGTLSNPSDVTSSFDVIQNNANGILTILNSKNYDVTSLSLYDVSGKLVINKLNLGAQDSFSISTAQLSEGVYVVQATTAENGNLSKKIIVARK